MRNAGWVAAQPQPPRTDASGLVDVAAQLLGLDGRSIESRHSAGLVRARQIVMLAGVEACGLKVKGLAVAIGRHAGSASRIYGQAASRQREDPAFAALAEQAIAALRAGSAMSETSAQGEESAQHSIRTTPGKYDGEGKREK